METIIRNTVAAVLDNLEINYQYKDSEFIFKVGEDEGDFTYCIEPNDEDEMITIVGYFPVCVPKESMDMVLRVINELNEKSIIGAFSIDPEDRRPSFHLANYVSDGAVNAKTVQMCILQVMGHLIHSFQTIAKAMYSNEQITLTFRNDNLCTKQLS